MNFKYIKYILFQLAFIGLFTNPGNGQSCNPRTVPCNSVINVAFGSSFESSEDRLCNGENTNNIFRKYLAVYQLIIDKSRYNKYEFHVSNSSSYIYLTKGSCNIENCFRSGRSIVLDNYCETDILYIWVEYSFIQSGNTDVTIEPETLLEIVCEGSPCLDCTSAQELLCNEKLEGRNTLSEENFVSEYCNGEFTGFNAPEKVFHFEPESTGEYIFSISDFEFNTSLDIFLLDECDQNSCIASSANSNSNGIKIISAELRRNRNYIIVVDGMGSSGAKFDIDVICEDGCFDNCCSDQDLGWLKIIQRNALEDCESCTNGSSNTTILQCSNVEKECFFKIIERKCSSRSSDPHYFTDENFTYYGCDGLPYFPDLSKKIESSLYWDCKKGLREECLPCYIDCCPEDQDLSWLDEHIDNILEVCNEDSLAINGIYQGDYKEACSFLVSRTQPFDPRIFADIYSCSGEIVQPFRFNSKSIYQKWLKEMGFVPLYTCNGGKEKCCRENCCDIEDTLSSLSNELGCNYRIYQCSYNQECVFEVRFNDTDEIGEELNILYDCGGNEIMRYAPADTGAPILENCMIAWVCEKGQVPLCMEEECTTNCCTEGTDLSWLEQVKENLIATLCITCDPFIKTSTYEGQCVFVVDWKDTNFGCGEVNRTVYQCNGDVLFSYGFFGTTPGYDPNLLTEGEIIWDCVNGDKKPCEEECEAMECENFDYGTNGNISTLSPATWTQIGTQDQFVGFEVDSKSPTVLYLVQNGASRYKAENSNSTNVSIDFVQVQLDIYTGARFALRNIGGDVLNITYRDWESIIGPTIEISLNGNLVQDRIAYSPKFAQSLNLDIAWDGQGLTILHDSQIMYSNSNLINNGGIVSLDVISGNYIGQDSFRNYLKKICFKKCPDGSNCRKFQENCDILSISNIKPISNSEYYVDVITDFNAQLIEGYALVIEGLSDTTIVSTPTFRCPVNRNCYLYVIYRDSEGCLVWCCIKVNISSNCTGEFEPIYSGDGFNMNYRFEPSDPDVSPIKYFIEGFTPLESNESILFDQSGKYKVCCLYYDQRSKCFRICCQFICVFPPYDFDLCKYIEIECNDEGDFELFVSEGSNVEQVLSWRLDSENGINLGNGNSITFDPTDYGLVEGDEAIVCIRYIDTNGCIRVCCKKICLVGSHPFDPDFQNCERIDFRYSGVGLIYEFCLDELLIGATPGYDPNLLTEGDIIWDYVNGDKKPCEEECITDCCTEGTDLSWLEQVKENLIDTLCITCEPFIKSSTYEGLCVFVVDWKDTNLGCGESNRTVYRCNGDELFSYGFFGTTPGYDPNLLIEGDIIWDCVNRDKKTCEEECITDCCTEGTDLSWLEQVKENLIDSLPITCEPSIELSTYEGMCVFVVDWKGTILGCGESNRTVYRCNGDELFSYGFNDREFFYGPGTKLKTKVRTRKSSSMPNRGNSQVVVDPETLDIDSMNCVQIDLSQFEGEEEVVVCFEFIDNFGCLIVSVRATTPL